MKDMVQQLSEKLEEAKKIEQNIVEYASRFTGRELVSIDYTDEDGVCFCTENGYIDHVSYNEIESQAIEELNSFIGKNIEIVSYGHSIVGKYIGFDFDEKVYVVSDDGEYHSGLLVGPVDDLT